MAERYRLVPRGKSCWGVQGKWLFWWRDIGRFTGYDYWAAYVFDSETEARDWLRDRLIQAAANEAERREIRERRRTVAPIEL